jgi:hypothetical protein
MEIKFNKATYLINKACLVKLSIATIYLEQIVVVTCSSLVALFENKIFKKKIKLSRKNVIVVKIRSNRAGTHNDV